MILSNEIEKALYKGECVYKTFNTGYTNTFTIPIPKGSYIILRQIIYYPVVSSNIDFLQRSCVQLSINEQGSNNEMLYIFRNNINSFDISLNPAVRDLVFTGGNPQTIETFKVFKKNACIDIGFNNRANNLLYFAPTTFVPQANERLTPLGYDTINIQSQALINGVTKSIYPTGEQREFNGQPFLAGNEDRLRYDFDANNSIPNVAVGTNNSAYQFPLFTFGYFEFQTAKSINLQ